tara:strand:+ start:3308 stop:4387 length:1080 start_codon:yes stop_codon:yes gene_type:complete
MLKKNLFEINNYKIFFISILICVLFFYFERLIGIDQFYHPDSLYYLKKHETYSHFVNNPGRILFTGYYYLARILNYDYLNLIILNFILFGLTNLLVYNLVLKKNFLSLNKFQIFLLSTILFFDPYRLHLTGHVLKETILIFLILSFLYFKSFFLKVIFLFISIFIKKNIIFYYLIFYTDDLVKRFFNIKNKIIYIYTAILITIFIFLFFYRFETFGGEYFSIFNYFVGSSVSFLETLEFWHYRDMSGRAYDNIPNFQNVSFPLALFFKITVWPLLIFSGFFLFFTDYFLLKILGFMMIYFNIVIFYLTKKSYLSIGLAILLILISLYSTTFTSYFRYSYVAIYCSIVFFLNNLFECQKN